MADILYPQRQSFRLAPRGHVEIDWHSSLSRGLVAAYFFGLSPTIYGDLTGSIGPSWGSDGTPPIVIGAPGPVVSLNGSSQSVIAVIDWHRLFPNSATAFTISALVYPTALSATHTILGQGH